MLSTREEAARWFARLRDAGPDHPDRGRFEAWLASSPANAAEYSAIEDAWTDFDSAARLERLAGAVERRGAGKAGPRQGRRKLLKRSGALAVLLAGGAAAWGGWEVRYGFPLAQFSAQTGIGETGRQALPDGSTVLLGPDVRIDVAYFRDRRSVTLAGGDAIFDVARDPGRPFVVDAGLARATVLGTRFAVNRGVRHVRISVDSGRVRVEDLSGGAPVMLDAGQVAVVEAGGNVHRIAAEAADGFAWQRGSLVFDNATLADIAASLSRYRRMPVRAPQAGDQRVTAVVQSADIEHFLHSLPAIAPVRIEERAAETLILSR